ncbi:hypothetical protein CC2G_006691 [Coprinopsis cinerea AmutBmut pab1-1]|nr:hypothetical protein CC2G_006691 [Coprinopsis cinerea AmutBmut pab1-1]
MSNPLGAGKGECSVYWHYRTPFLHLAKGDLSGIVNNLKGTIDNPGVPILQRQQAQRATAVPHQGQHRPWRYPEYPGAVGDVAGTAGGLAGRLTGEQGAGGVLGGLTGGGGGGEVSSNSPSPAAVVSLAVVIKGRNKAASKALAAGRPPWWCWRYPRRRSQLPTADSQILKHYIGTLQNPNASQTAKNQAKKVLQDSGIDLSSV